MNDAQRDAAVRFKFSAGEARHLADVLGQWGKPRNPTQEDQLWAWIEYFKTGRACKLEPADAKRLISLMTACCRPEPHQRKEFDRIIKRLQGSR